MPLVSLITNLSDDKVPRTLNKAFSEFLAKLFNKSVDGFSVLVSVGQRFTRGGTDDPAVMLVVFQFF